MSKVVCYPISFVLANKSGIKNAAHIRMTKDARMLTEEGEFAYRRRHEPKGLEGVEVNSEDKEEEGDKWNQGNRQRGSRQGQTG
jgi:hypothetical protein